MPQIQDYFKKFEKIFSYQKNKLEKIKEVVFSYTNINLEDKNIKISNGKIFLNIKPTQKNAILLKKSKILEDLNSFSGLEKIKEIF